MQSRSVFSATSDDINDISAHFGMFNDFCLMILQKVMVLIV